MKRLILFLLVAMLLLTSMTGCLFDKPQNNETTPQEGTPFGTTPSLPEDQTTPPEVDVVVPAPDGEHPFGTEDVSFNAGTFTQLIALSSSYILNVEVKDGQIYLCDVLYECKGIVDNFDISLQDAFLVGVEEEKIEILEKIQNCETCYLLETQNDNIYGKKIAVYYIDGFYYFLNPAEEAPMRIHFAKASADEPPANNATVPTPVAGAPLGRETTTLVADLYASYGDGVREDTLDIKVVKGQIFINDIAYTVFQNTECPEIDYEADAICSPIINSATAIETLKKIESSSLCWTLETNDLNNPLGYRVSIYYVDGTYYFLTYFGNGTFRGLYYASPGKLVPPEIINDLTMGTYYLPYSLKSEPITLTFYKNGRFEAKYPDDAEEPYCNYYRVENGKVFLSIENPEKSHVFTILENALLFDEKASTANLWDSLAWTREVIYYLPDVSESEIIATAVMAENGLQTLPSIGKIYGKYEHIVGSNTYDAYAFILAEGDDFIWSDKIWGTPYTFTYSNGSEIYIYYQGKLLTLNEAFDRSIITLDILAELNQDHHNCGIAHSYDDGVITQIADADIDVILYTCYICGETHTVELPDDFSFSLTWSFDGEYDSQTGHLENGYNYKLGAKCETTLVLTREELMDVYRLLYNANAFEIKEDFVVGNVLVEPYYDIEISYTINGETIDFTIDGEVFARYYTDWELYPEFGYAYYKIVDFIKNTEEYKALPPNTNMYY